VSPTVALDVEIGIVRQPDQEVEARVVARGQAHGPPPKGPKGSQKVAKGPKRSRRVQKVQRVSNVPKGPKRSQRVPKCPKKLKFSMYEFF